MSTAQGAVLRPIGPAGINRPIPISVPGRRFSEKRSKRTRSKRTRSKRRSKKTRSKFNFRMKKGALRAMAPPHAFTKKGTLKVSWLRKASKEPGILGRRARLALAFKRFRRNH